MYEKSETKELTLGERIYDLLKDCHPEEKRTALRQAEERIHLDFEARKNKLQEDAKQLEEEWRLFKES